MIAKKLEFQMRFGLSLPGFAMTPGSIEYYPGCKPEGPSGPPQDAPDGPPAGGPERGDGPAPEMPAQDYLLTIEEKDGVLSAYEFKWKPGKIANLPQPFQKAYPQTKIITVTPDNYQNFVSF